MKSLDEYKEDLYSLCQICKNCTSKKSVVTNVATSHSKNKLHKSVYSCKYNVVKTTKGYIATIGECEYFTEDKNELLRFKIRKK